MTWIETISYEAARGRLKAIYERIKGPDDNVDNILMAHSLRPHTLEGHMTLYKYVLHHPSNTLPKWLLEAIGTYVSILNKCSYCIDHHFAGLRRLLANDERADALRIAFDSHAPETAAGHLSERDIAALTYAALLTQTPSGVTEQDIQTLRAPGLTDGEILEVNPVTAGQARSTKRLDVLFGDA